MNNKNSEKLSVDSMYQPFLEAAISVKEFLEEKYRLEANHKIQSVKAKAQQTETDYQQQLKALQQEIDNQQQHTHSLEEKVTLLTAENQNKATKLEKTKRALKYSNQKLENNRQYIKELEEKYNKVQKELFDNWVQEKT